MGQLRHRRVSFEFSPDLTPSWNPALPEFSAAANAVSLMMPYVEPFVIRAVREQVPFLRASGRDDLAHDAQLYVRQEAEHQTQHRRFNATLSHQVRGVAFVERLLARTYRMLWNRGSERFHLAFATASESAAYGVARWVERNHAQLFAQADPTVASLFLWHLAEEVEHKDVAYDLYDARYSSRLPLGAAMIVAVVLLAAFTAIGTTIGLAQQRRLF
ncbi:MAG: metal-dependent hydrolase, partial [Actinobacteria bacterium]|nr:metal-dependent hydrolase [Actinomycetota bacterium]